MEEDLSGALNSISLEQKDSGMDSFGYVVHILFKAIFLIMYVFGVQRILL